MTRSKLGPSAAKRWLACPGSVALAERMEVEVAAGPVAVYGEAVHALLEDVINDGVDPVDMLGTMRPLKNSQAAAQIGTLVDGQLMIRVDHEMLAMVDAVLDVARELEAELGPAEQRLTEQRVDLNPILPGCGIYGTADLLMKWPGVIAVIDLKTGWSEVDSDTPQTKLYGLGALALFGEPVDTVRTYIVQPRSKSPVKRADYSAAELVEWAETTVAPAVAAVEEARKRPWAYLNYGDHCQYCPAKGRCPALVFAALDAPDNKDIVELSDASLGEVMTKLNQVKSVIDHIKSEVMQRLSAGRKVPGWSLTTGRGVRVWKPGAAEVLVQRYGDAAYRRELLSPAQIEQAFPDGRLVTAEWAVLTPGRLTIAPDNANPSDVQPGTLVERLVAKAKGAYSA